MEKILSFDIELADVFTQEDGEEMEAYAPFHISVAATVVPGGEERIWYSEDANHAPLLRLTESRARELLAYLAGKRDEGYKLFAWNGLKFDLRWIGYAAGDMEAARNIASALYDPMFQFFCRKGFPISLEAVARGMEVSRSKTMSGADAPKEWVAGNFEKVFEYVLNDCRITNDVVVKIAERKAIAWITRKGERREEPLDPLMPVESLLGGPDPDQSWMSRPILKKSFYQWFPGEKIDCRGMD
jgi:hypothetical protein